jgi:hypothetical protein
VFRYGRTSQGIRTHVSLESMESEGNGRGTSVSKDESMIVGSVP